MILLDHLIDAYQHRKDVAELCDCRAMVLHEMLCDLRRVNRELTNQTNPRGAS